MKKLVQEWIHPRGHDVAVLFSRRSREAYAAEAASRGETYTFTDAWGQPRTWLKGEYAYLAPAAASVLLARCNIKHNVVEEADLSDDRLPGYRAILVPNAAHLADETMERIEHWLPGSGHRLIVTGKTNLPSHLLGLAARTPTPVTGYTGWHWLPDSPFGNAAWENLYVSGFAGHRVQRIRPAPGSRVLADLVELTGDMTDATTATVSAVGPAIVLTDRTIYIANQVLELLGGMLQAHLNVEAVRHWSNPTHWGDTLLFFLRRLLLDVGLDSLWQTRLRSFGAYDGVLSFRHDVHGMPDFNFLDYQVQNLIPASYDIEDPSISATASEAMTAEWLARTTRYSFIEPALHNDSALGDPPAAVHGVGLYEHVRNAGEKLGIAVHTCGRHAGGHMHPETIDAMDYLYAHDDRILGHVHFLLLPHDRVRRAKPGRDDRRARRADRRQGAYLRDRYPAHDRHSGRLVSVPSRRHDRRRVAPSPRLGPHARIRRCLRIGRDDLRRSQRPRRRRRDHLENGVYSFQYHPELARDPSVNEGKGALDYLRYTINLAERNNFWIANQRELYQRMADYEELVFQVRDGGREVTVTNPTGKAHLRDGRRATPPVRERLGWR